VKPIKLLKDFSCEELVEFVAQNLDKYKELNPKISVLISEKMEARYDPEERAILSREKEKLEKRQDKAARNVVNGLLFLREKEECSVQDLEKLM